MSALDFLLPWESQPQSPTEAAQPWAQSIDLLWNGATPFHNGKPGGGQGTQNGNPTQGYLREGVTRVFDGTDDAYRFPGSYAGTGKDITLCAVVNLNAISSIITGTSNTATGLTLSVNSSQLLKLTKFGVVDIVSSLVVGNVPTYFVAASYTHSSGAIVFFTKRYDTGEVAVATATNSSAWLAGDGTSYVGTPGFSSTGFSGESPFVAHIGAALTEVQLRNLAENPWQLFAPQRIEVPVPAAAPTGYTLTAAAGSFALTGNATGLRADRKLTAAAGSFALTGNAAGLYLGHRLSAAAASYAWTGNAASLVTSRRLVAAAGAYVLTGNAAALRINRLLAAASGSYSFTGNDASLVHSTPGSYSLTANAGAYSLTGNAAALRADRRLTAAAGVFNLTGSVAQLLRGYRLAAAAGAFALTGNAATLSASQSYSLSAAAGAYALTGNAATLTYSGEVFTDSEFWKYTIPAQNLLYTVPPQNLVYQVPAAA